MGSHPSVKFARKAFDHLSFAFDSHNVNHAANLLAMCKQEERGHRGFMEGFTRCHTGDTATITDAAKLFAVKRVAEYLLGAKMPVGQAFLHTQHSCFQAAAIADEFASEVREAWKSFELREIVALDYKDIVKVKEAAYTNPRNFSKLEPASLTSMRAALHKATGRQHAPGCSGDCGTMPDGRLACATPIEQV